MLIQKKDIIWTNISVVSHFLNCHMRIFVEDSNVIDREDTFKATIFNDILQKISNLNTFRPADIWTLKSPLPAYFKGTEKN